MGDDMFQYFICNKKDISEELLVRLVGKNLEYLDYDGNWKEYNNSGFNGANEYREITKLQADALINKKYKFYIYNKGVSKLVRLFNGIHLQIYDEEKEQWISAPNAEWLKSILLEGDDDFIQISNEQAKQYTETKINNKKITR